MGPLQVSGNTPIAPPGTSGSISPANGSELPLAAARKRLTGDLKPRKDGKAKSAKDGKRGPDKSRRVRKGEQPTPAELETVAELAAAGASRASISRDTRMSHYLVTRILARPDVLAYMTRCREAIRSMTMDGIVKIQEETVSWARDVAVAKQDAKSLELVTRSMANLEKVAGSASGENKPHILVDNRSITIDVEGELESLKKFLAIAQ